MARRLISSGSSFERDFGYSRAVVVGEVPIRLGVTQFLEASGTWFVRAQFEWVPFARHSFKHDGETQAAFQPGATWGLGGRVGARF